MIIMFVRFKVRIDKEMKPSLEAKYPFVRNRDSKKFLGKVGKLLNYKVGIPNDRICIVVFLDKWCNHINLFKVALFPEEIEWADESEAKEFIELHKELYGKVVAEKL